MVFWQHMLTILQEGIRIDWMSNVERTSIEHDSVDLLLNKFQRNRGDTLNSGGLASPYFVLSTTEGW